MGVCRLFELFTTTLDVILHKARNEGQLDSGIVDIKANKIELQGSPKVKPFAFGEMLAFSSILTESDLVNFAFCCVPVL